VVVDRVRIGIIGDHDPDYPVHGATNTALEVAGRKLSTAVDYEWLATDSLAPGDLDRLIGFDGLWAAPGGPYRSLDGALSGIRFARERGIPFVGT
jgi:CTP synthase (UTP-ammonia lyase)